MQWPQQLASDWRQAQAQAELEAQLRRPDWRLALDEQEKKWAEERKEFW